MPLRSLRAGLPAIALFIAAPAAVAVGATFEGVWYAAIFAPDGRDWRFIAVDGGDVR